MYLEKFKLAETAIVTGGGPGTALGCVEALAEAGAKVVIADCGAKVAEAGGQMKAGQMKTEVTSRRHLLVATMSGGHLG